MRRMPQFLVWNPDAGFPTMAHATIEDAVKESERLAKINHGHRFFVMAPVGKSIVEEPKIFQPDDTWEYRPF